MSRRTERVGELLRRELANALIRGELRDPALGGGAGIAITGVQVSGDLGHARVFVDVLSAELRVESVVAALQRGRGRLERLLGEVLSMRRIPTLRFEHDASIENGARIESILGELASEREQRPNDDAAGESDGE